MILEGQQQQRNRFLDMPSRIRISAADSHHKTSRPMPKIQETNGRHSIWNHHHNCPIENGTNPPKKLILPVPVSEMATVTTQASAAVFRPCASRSRFLTGSSGRLNRLVSVKQSVSSFKSFKVEAKKGEWLPGLASPTYLDGRCDDHKFTMHGSVFRLSVYVK